MHILACVGVRPIDLIERGIVLTNGAESSMVSEMKGKHNQDPIILDLKACIHSQRVILSNKGEMVC